MDTSQENKMSHRGNASALLARIIGTIRVSGSTSAHKVTRWAKRTGVLNMTSARNGRKTNNVRINSFALDSGSATSTAVGICHRDTDACDKHFVIRFGNH